MNSKQQPYTPNPGIFPEAYQAFEKWIEELTGDLPIGHAAMSRAAAVLERTAADPATGNTGTRAVLASLARLVRGVANT